MVFYVQKEKSPKLFAEAPLSHFRGGGDTFMINRIHKEDGSDTVVLTTGSHEDSYLSERTYVLPRIGEYSFK